MAKFSSKKDGRYTHLSISSLFVRLPLLIIVFCGGISIVNSMFGYRQFQRVFADMYNSITVQSAYIAESYINGDKVSEWLRSGVPDEDWEVTNQKLTQLTNIADLVFIYLFVPDEDYKNRTYIFDTVNATASNYKSFPLGYTESLKNKTPEYINNVKRLMLTGKRYTYYSYNKKNGGHITTAIPVRNSANNVVGVLSVIRPMKEILDVRNRYRNSTIITSVVCLLFIIALFVFFVYHWIVRPLLLITYETSHFVQHGGSLTGLLKKIKGRSELAVLAKSVEQMSLDMNHYIEDLTHMAAEKERIGAELNVATQIQANMLPRIFPPYENHQEIELFATMEPAKEVGGDFYDFFMVDDDHFAVIVGDVSGKGVPAALFMVIAKTLLKNAALHCGSPAEIFDQVNNELCEGNDAGLFVTCWLGILCISEHKLVFANAGHPAPVLFHNGTAEYLVSKPNLMLAGMQGIKYREYSVDVETGDGVFLYTDGVTEATNANNELYGEQRLLNITRKITSKSSKEILATIKNDVDAFVKDAPQFDDITMLELVLKQ